MELIVRQTTELGVGAVIPVESDNSQIRLKGKGAEKSQRWQKSSRCCGGTMRPWKNSQSVYSVFFGAGLGHAGK